MKLNAILESQPGGGYTAYVPALPGCISEGETIGQATKNLREALKGYLLVANKRSLALAQKKDARAISLRL